MSELLVCEKCNYDLFMVYEDGIMTCNHCGELNHFPEKAIALKPLTDEQIEDLYFDNFSMSSLKEFARAIEKEHGILGADNE